MRPQIKAAVWIGVTFAAGTAFGMVLNGALSNRASVAVPPAIQPGGPPRAPLNGDRPRGPAGFVAEMERVIQPHDEVQRNQLRPFLEATDRSNRAIVDRARSSMAAALDSLRTAIGPLLDGPQRQRLAEFGGPPKGEAAPGMDGRGMPPDGRGREMGRGSGGLPGGPPPDEIRPSGPSRGGPPH